MESDHLTVKKFAGFWGTRRLIAFPQQPNFIPYIELDKSQAQCSYFSVRYVLMLHA
jgi:hypothetical protein